MNFMECKNLSHRTTIQKKIWHLIAALSFVIAYNLYLNEGDLTGWESVLNYVLFMSIYCMLGHVERCDRRLRLIAMLFSVLYSIVFVIGYFLYDLGRFSSIFSPVINLIKAVVMIVGMTIVLRVLICHVIMFFERVGKALDDYRCPCSWIESKHIFWIFWLLIFLSWIPAFLAYYPGMLSYDAPTQMLQIAKGLDSYNRHHPPLHTMIIGLCIEIDKITGIHGIAFYSILQMLFLSFALAYTLRFLVNREINWRLILLVLIFYMVNPVVAILSLAITKDIPFTASLLITVILLCEIYADKKSFFDSGKKVTGLVASICLSCLFRNNAIYAFVISIPFILWGIPKVRHKTMVLILTALCSALVISGPLYDSLGIQEGYSKEMLSVPMMQIADVVYYDGETLSEVDKEIISWYIPYDDVSTLFNPRLADPIKEQFDEWMYKDLTNTFYELWGNLLLRYPDNYVTSFLNLNLPYWYQDSHAVDEYSSVAYIETQIVDSPEYPMERESKAPWLLENYYAKVASFELFKGKPLLSTFFQLSTPIWVFIFAFFVLMYKRIPSKFFAFMPMVGLWFTYLLGPVSNFRYIFPLHVFMAFLLVVMIQPQKIFGSDNTEK